MSARLASVNSVEVDPERTSRRASQSSGSRRARTGSSLVRTMAPRLNRAASMKAPTSALTESPRL
jgi:hypothetical protein